MNAAERQMLIMATLYKERNVTMKQLADTLGCCTRTVHRDIQALSVSFPLITIQGRFGGGVRLEDYHQQRNHRYLTPEQIHALRSAMKTADPPARPILSSIIDQFSPLRNY